jgi:hypothetical protein
MEEWAKNMAGHWRLPHGVSDEEAKPVKVEVEEVEETKAILWSAKDGRGS